MHYAWVVAAVTYLTLLVAAGLRSTPGVLIVPLEAEFGWSRGSEALQLLIAVDRRASKIWGIGSKSESVARSALTHVAAKSR